MQTFNFKRMLLLVAASSLFFVGCKKEVVSSPAAGEEVSSSRVTSENAAPKPVHIRASFTADNFPNVAGTFIASGALGNNTGTATMAIGGLTPQGLVAHCIVVLTFYNADHSVKGTITIKQECQFASPYPDNKGQWQIVSGTGAYTGIKGNGITTMPPPFDEDMTGVIL